MTTHVTATPHLNLNLHMTFWRKAGSFRGVPSLIWPVIHLQREWRRGIRLFPRGAGLLGQKVCFERIKLCHASYKLEEDLQSKLDFSRWSGGENFHEIRGPNGSSGGPSKVSEAPLCPSTRRCKVHPVEEIEGLHP